MFSFIKKFWGNYLKKSTSTECDNFYLKNPNNVLKVSGTGSYCSSKPISKVDFDVRYIPMSASLRIYKNSEIIGMTYPINKSNLNESEFESYKCNINEFDISVMVPGVYYYIFRSDTSYDEIQIYTKKGVLIKNK